ncbi:MAG: hypothetical protein PHI90_05745 [Clostridia bacterium]|nr:hypothetical protein [Clostridia bacterium]MDD4048315.1 hypothetical protein [Clostridia bacterium]
MNICENDLESSILENINKLVTIIINASQEDVAEKDNLIEKAKDLIVKTNPLILQLINGDEKLLMQTYKQLILQKLPPSDTLNIFGNLENTFKLIFPLHILKSNNSSQQSNMNITKNPLSNKIKINLDMFVKFLYPKENIIKDHYLGSTKIDYLLPDKKIAILLTSPIHRRTANFNLLMKKSKLHLVELFPQDLINGQLLLKKLPHF